MLNRLRKLTRQSVRGVAQALGVQTVSDDELKASIDEARNIMGLMTQPGWRKFSAFITERKAQLTQLTIYGDEDQAHESRLRLRELELLWSWKDRALEEGEKAKERLDGKRRS